MLLRRKIHLELYSTLHIKRATVATLRRKKKRGKEAVGGCFLLICSPKMTLESLLDML